ncbi:Protein of unknown function [Bacillus cytotoxicus]|uniref:Uncharacterized protein n=1 Tax=Bacillus cytotoxicus TaxID=580165 RepID=A0AAX2CGZ7_9BACI|nr:Protein of unknown function [Bacillus cytotoxicus]
MYHIIPRFKEELWHFESYDAKAPHHIIPRFKEELWHYFR